MHLGSLHFGTHAHELGFVVTSLFFMGPFSCVLALVCLRPFMGSLQALTPFCWLVFVCWQFSWAHPHMFAAFVGSICGSFCKVQSRKTLCSSPFSPQTPKNPKYKTRKLVFCIIFPFYNERVGQANKIKP